MEEQKIGMEQVIISGPSNNYEKKENQRWWCQNYIFI